MWWRSNVPFSDWTEKTKQEEIITKIRQVEVLLGHMYPENSIIPRPAQY
jgi:hypothetical protein